jgi:hypothetical protein
VTTPPGARDAALKREGLTAVEVARFSGRITIDGLPPETAKTLFVFLVDPKNSPIGPLHPVAHKICNPDGSFAFNTYAGDDGYRPGHYVLAFAILRRGSGRKFHGPDGLKNLYNDPEVNAIKPEFVLDLAPPGITDFSLDLKVADEQPVEQPGPHAITALD